MCEMTVIDSYCEQEKKKRGKVGENEGWGRHSLEFEEIIV